MNKGHLWICLVEITPSNNPGTERELLPYMIGNSPVLPYMVKGNPTGHGIQFQGMGILLVIFVKDLHQGNNPLGHQILISHSSPACN